MGGVHHDAVRAEPDLELAERLSGAVWGALIGDAVGVPYEFGPPVPKDTVEFGRSGTYGMPPGTWSDDGSLLLALLDSLLTVGFDPNDQGARYLAWDDDGAYTPDGEGKFDIGNTTAEALDRIRDGVAAEEAGGGATALGNGSLMRTLPIALLGLDLEPSQLIDQASRASAVTHAADVARATCALYVLIASAILRGERDRTAVLASAMRDSPGVRRRRSRDARRRSSIGRHARVGAMSSTRSGRHGTPLPAPTTYRETITRAVAYGHDTDTTACIAGGLAGAYWGFDRHPAGVAGPDARPPPGRCRHRPRCSSLAAGGRRAAIPFESTPSTCPACPGWPMPRARSA